MNEVREAMQEVHREATSIKAALERMERDRSGAKNTTTVKIEGGGGIWAGLAIGVCLGASIACAVWTGFSLSSMADEQRQQEAYIQATYQAVPAMREEFDRIKQESQHEQRSDHHRTAAATPAAAAGR